jgi:hypothetical protein
MAGRRSRCSAIRRTCSRASGRACACASTSTGSNAGGGKRRSCNAGGCHQQCELDQTQRFEFPGYFGRSRRQSLDFRSVFRSRSNEGGPLVTGPRPTQLFQAVSEPQSLRVPAKPPPRRVPAEIIPSDWTRAGVNDRPDVLAAQRGSEPARHESVHDLHAFDVARGRHDLEQRAVERQRALELRKIGAACLAE